MNATNLSIDTDIELSKSTLDSTLDLLALLIEEIDSEGPHKGLNQKEQATRATILGFRAPFLRALALASSTMIKEVYSELESIQKLNEGTKQ